MVVIPGNEKKVKPELLKSQARVHPSAGLDHLVQGVDVHVAIGVHDRDSGDAVLDAAANELDRVGVARVQDDLDVRDALGVTADLERETLGVQRQVPGAEHRESAVTDLLSDDFGYLVSHT